MKYKMLNEKDNTIYMLHICDYAAPYKGNFIESLEYFEEKTEGVMNLYLFPQRASNTATLKWINQINEKEQRAFIQKASFVGNFHLLYKMLKEYRVKYVFRHFTDLKIDIILNVLFDNKRVIRFFHNMFDFGSSKKIKHVFSKRVLNNLWKDNVMVGVSEAVSECIKNTFKGNKIITIENAINFQRLTHIESFERQDNISLLVMGYNTKIKGVDLAIRAVQILREKYDVILNIIAASHYEELSNCIVEILGEIPEWIYILDAKNNIATYYNAVDIFLSPSRTEAFGYSVVEAAYCEKSIVASKVDGQGQLDISGIYWVESENIKELCVQIERAILELDCSEHNKLKQSVAQYVQNRYSLRQWCDQINEVIKSIEKN